jgi:mono/diheme cytochrome c family protein
MRARAWILVAAVVTMTFIVTAAGCGGDDDSGTTAANTAEETTTGGGGGSTAGAAVFASAGCGGCHTLAAAGSTGSTGPNLDDVQPDKETVVSQVTNGGGGMPAFGDRLSEQEIQDVATYVSESAGS